jgi:hypothetical protein
MTVVDLGRWWRVRIILRSERPAGSKRTDEQSYAQENDRRQQVLGIADRKRIDGRYEKEIECKHSQDRAHDRSGATESSRCEYNAQEVHHGEIRRREPH